MIDFSGWVALSDSPFDGELAEVPRRVIELRRQIAELDLPSVYVHFENPNGQAVLLVCGAGNRRRPEHAEFEDLVVWLANELPGSWGVIYWRDDEGEPRNAYRIMRIARGQVTWHDDTLLSPCNPVIED